MTVTDAPARTNSRATADPRPDPHGGVVVAVGTSIGLLAVILLGFGLYLFAFSRVAESRAQTTEFKTFRNQLGEAIAPHGPTSAGTPVAILSIPEIGLTNAVVVEGTSGGSLTRGPGHRADTPLPGQAGVSVIYGRHVTFGAPFAKLDQLGAGDIITTTSSAGVAKYQVAAFGTKDHPMVTTGTNRLVLVTADGGNFYAGSTVTISATLITKPMVVSNAYPQIPDSDRALGSDHDVVLPLMLWSAALVLAVTAATFLRDRWATWPTYICATPVVLAVLWNIYENAAQLLPNVY